MRRLEAGRPVSYGEKRTARGEEKQETNRCARSRVREEDGEQKVAGLMLQVWKTCSRPAGAMGP